MNKKKYHVTIHPLVNLEKIQSLDLFLVDSHGLLRGKKIIKNKILPVLEEGIKMPFSYLLADIFGDDASQVFYEWGDGDGTCHLTSLGILPNPWEPETKAQAIVTMYHKSDKPFFLDPRQILSHVVSKYEKRKLKAVIATELEFYLFDKKEAQNNKVVPPFELKSGFRLSPYIQTASMNDLEEFSPFMDDITKAANMLGIEVETALSESGPGQFEFNVHHEADPLIVADKTILLKKIIKEAAAKYNMIASFMAKPYGYEEGNGMHIHFSILDHDNKNIFNNSKPSGSNQLRQAIAGLIKLAPESMLIFAPNLNSCRRFAKNSMAPTVLSWGYDNRTASIRIPYSSNTARRIEHRIAGADANPYLVIAAILDAALYGLDNDFPLSKPIKGNVADYSDDVDDDDVAGIDDHFSRIWEDSLKNFDDSEFFRESFSSLFIDSFIFCKEQELERFNKYITEMEYQTYLRQV